MSGAAIGPWEPKRRHHYADGPRKWVLERKNPAITWGGIETLLTKSYAIRRFNSEEAAGRVAKELNAAAPEPQS